MLSRGAAAALPERTEYRAESEAKAELAAGWPRPPAPRQASVFPAPASLVSVLPACRAFSRAARVAGCRCANAPLLRWTLGAQAATMAQPPAPQTLPAPQAVLTPPRQRAAWVAATCRLPRGARAQVPLRARPAPREARPAPRARLTRRRCGEFPRRQAA